MKKFIVKHKIVVSMLLLLLIFNTWFVMSAKRLNIPTDNIESISVESLYLDKDLCFTNKKVINKTLKMLNGYLLKDASFADRKGESGFTVLVVINYKNGHEEMISIYNEGFVLISDGKKSSCYKKYGFGLPGKKAAKFFSKYEHLAVSEDI